LVLFSATSGGLEFKLKVVADKPVEIQIPYFEIPSGQTPLKCGYVDFTTKKFDVSICKMVPG
jgi:hypothetical protein